MSRYSPHLLERLDALIRRRSQEVTEIAADRNRETLAYVSYALGLQDALELAQLGPQTALDLIGALHARIALDDPDAAVEFNTAAQAFLQTPVA